ncbi:MAG: hypothetical protein LC808_04595 [Actinobacteria bacterium]|nr:hypothetical protein [Actinomycetota bacterium]
MEVDPTRMCELLIGLPAVVVLGIVDEGPWLTAAGARRDAQRSSAVWWLRRAKQG